MDFDFEDIRSYRDNEVVDVLKRVVYDKGFEQLVFPILGRDKVQEFRKEIENMKSVKQFQETIVCDFLESLAKKISSELILRGIERVKKDDSYLYLTNHRDIILDASLLNLFLHRSGFDLTEIAIGNNLLFAPWIRDLSRLNKSFVVKRDVTVRGLLLSSQKLSAYIRDTIINRRQSVWMAQREGRAKNSDDRTQTSVLKMLVMSGTGALKNNMEALNIVPVSICYEYDSSDYLKAKEFQQKRDNPEFKKHPLDDFENMRAGVFGFKGKIAFSIGKPLNEIDTDSIEALPKNKQLEELASVIDREIFRNYYFFPINYIAYDEMFQSDRFVNTYTKEDKQVYESYMQKQLDKINIPNKDVSFLRRKMIEMYANPLVNQLSLLEK